MMHEQMETAVKCWNCNEPLVKVGINKGLIKSQLIFFENNTMVAKCKKCKENNVLTQFTLTKSQAFPEPKLVLSLGENKFEKPLAKSNKVNYNKGEELKRAKVQKRNESPEKLKS